MAKGCEEYDWASMDCPIKIESEVAIRVPYTTMAYTPGNFRFKKSSYPSADELLDAYQAITKAEAWELIRKDPGDGGFMFSTSIDLSNVHKHMTLLENHSGASYGIMMRHMQYIARNGWDKYVQLIVEQERSITPVE